MERKKEETDVFHSEPREERRTQVKEETHVSHCSTSKRDTYTYTGRERERGRGGGAEEEGVRGEKGLRETIKNVLPSAAQ